MWIGKKEQMQDEIGRLKYNMDYFGATNKHVDSWAGDFNAFGEYDYIISESVLEQLANELHSIHSS